MSTSTAPALDSWDRVLALAIGSNLGNLSFLALPMWLGTVITRYDLSQQAAGRIASLELAFVTVLALALSPKVDRLPWRSLCYCGLILSMIGNGVTIWAPHWQFLIAGRVLVGLGGGVMTAIIYGAAATTANPQRTFSTIAITLTLFFLVIMMLGPIAIKHYSAQGIFGLMLALQSLGLLFFSRLPARHEGAAEERPPFPRTPLVMIGLLALTFLQTGNSMIWAYTAKIGESTGLTLEGVGRVLAISSVVAMAGPLAARVLGHRFGRAMPLLIGISLVATCVMALSHSGRSEVYSGASILLPLCVLFANPYVMAVLAGLDERGRVAAASPAFSNIGNTLGPFLGSLVLVGGDYSTLGKAALAVYILSIVSFMRPARRQDAAARKAF